MSRAKFTGIDYVNAVKKTGNLIDNQIAKVLKVDRSRVSRFRRNEKNSKFVEQAKAYLDTIADLEFTPELNNFNVFYNSAIVKEWDRKQIRRGVSSDRRTDMHRAIWHICKWLEVHPVNLSLDECAEVCDEAKLLSDADEPPLKLGLSYYTIREAIRDFFATIHGVNKFDLADAVPKPPSKGQHKYAKQRVTKEQRDEFVRTLAVRFDDNFNDYLETLYYCKFMFYTGGRPSASAIVGFMRPYSLTKNRWVFEILDKGRHGGQKWDKVLTGVHLDDFRVYCSKRFNIPIESLETELRKKTDYLFPSLVKMERGVARLSATRAKIKRALIDAGVDYDDFMPLHIWRHTFAQEFLPTCKYNYELTASVGGWLNSFVLKRHYGEVPTDAIADKLLESQGLEVSQEQRVILW